jgi:hypothetical protein
MVLAVR